MRTRSNLPSSFADLWEVDEADRQFNNSIAKGFDVLRAFGNGDGPLGNQEIASRTGIPKPTVSRITYTLTKLGYLEFLPRWSKYQLGPGILALGFSFLKSYRLRELASPHLKAIAGQLDLSIALGARDGLHIVYIDVERGPSVLPLKFDIGSRLPIDASAIGLTYLAAIGQDECNYIMSAITERGAGIIENVSDLMRQAAVDIQDRGFFAGLGLVQRGINCVATPLLSPDQRAYFVLSATAPAADLSANRVFEEVGPRLALTADLIQQDWAHAGPSNTIVENDNVLT